MGKVSREEFANLVNKEFDQLDVNKDGGLDVTEVTGFHHTAKRLGGADSR